jgi:hypothetical protein
MVSNSPYGRLEHGKAKSPMKTWGAVLALSSWPEDTSAALQRPLARSSVLASRPFDPPWRPCVEPCSSFLPRIELAWLLCGSASQLGILPDHAPSGLTIRLWSSELEEEDEEELELEAALRGVGR